ncbi:gamma carbonic anhydrase family protein [Saccharopolyspora rhizosphaerae]|uniref:Gamma carbonic anhydrase family protein n=1 Tax=Saccharopolyspora rhizosphaerae TaxID=2492662 RepID=A0A426K541_9PSEU|nr:gamma carbonic anhydrase family protein [Saccharopolyspora rhizosphaerae]RRO20516.1 gamma carbonic anhydrase family protein [Saccharopolyspora rhizosphaerae]
MNDPLTVTVDDITPQIHPEAFIAPGTSLIGRVDIAAQASIWYGAVLRGDQEDITIGASTNVQDGTVIHADPGFPAHIHPEVTVGHRAVLHGCTVESGSLIGMGSVVLNGARIGAGSLVAAGAVVLEGTEVPPGSLVAGTPGKVRRELSDDEQAALKLSVEQYLNLAAKHRNTLG